MRLSLDSPQGSGLLNTHILFAVCQSYLRLLEFFQHNRTSTSFNIPPKFQSLLTKRCAISQKIGQNVNIAVILCRT